MHLFFLVYYFFIINSMGKHVHVCVTSFITARGFSHAIPDLSATCL